MRIYFTICACIIALCSENLFAKTLQGEKIFESMKGKVFKIKTSLGLNSEKVSYGSGFPISKDGLIISNYHVVAKALDRDENYKVIVVIDEQKYDAKVLNFSVTHDLSLLKIDKTFSEIVPIASKEPKKGERIFSLGYPQDLDLTIIEGVFNGDEINGNYKQYHVSAPINGGMSGGPAVNGNSELVGVNVSGLVGAQNVSFLVPKEFVEEVSQDIQVENYMESADLVDQKIKSNLMVTQEKLLEDFFKNAKRISFGIFSFYKGPESLKCWEKDDSDKDRHLFKSLINYCYVRAASYIKDDTYSGSYALTYNYFESDKLWKPAFYSLLSANFSHNISLEEVLIRFSKNIYTTNNSCQSEVLHNDSGIPFKVSYCLNGYNHMGQLRDINFRAITLLKDTKGLLIKFKLSGFTIDSIEKFMVHILNGVKLHDS